MSWFEYAYEIFRFLFLSGLIFTSVSLIFFLLHPVDLKLFSRITPRCHRSRLRARHFFGLAALELTASINEQSLYFCIWKKRWRIKRWARQRPAPPEKPSPPRPTTPADDNAPQIIDKMPEKPDMTTQDQTHDAERIDRQPSLIHGAEKRKVSDMPETIEPPVAEMSHEKTESLPAANQLPPDQPCREQTVKDEPEKPEPVDLGSSASSGNPTVESSDRETGTQSYWAEAMESIRAGIKKLRKDLKTGIKSARKWIKLAFHYWTRFSPVIGRFLANLWRSFSVDGPCIFCKYALPDPFLTGIIHGTVSQVSGMLWPLGLRVYPIPAFPGPALYLRTNFGIRIFPWRVLGMTLRLFAEKEIWKGAWQLWKRYRNRNKS